MKKQKKFNPKRHFLEMDEIKRGKHVRKPKAPPTIIHRGDETYNRKNKSWKEEIDE